MPTNTDLVTNLPADFAVFGQAVATSMGDLLGGTTGQILAKATNTDMDFTWITNDIGDITAVTATSPLTGGGTSGAITVGIQDASTTQKGSVQLSDSTSTTSSTLAATPTAVKAAKDAADAAQTTATAAIAKSTVTTAGDIIYRDATVPARLGIGTAGQVLTVNAGATAPEWATASGGGMTLLSTTTLSGTSTSITVAPTGYTSLKVILKGVYSTANDAVFMRLNGDSGTNYSWNAFRASGGGAPGSVSNESYANVYYIFNAMVTSNTTKLNGNMEMDIWFPNSTDFVNTTWTSLGGPTGSFWLTNGMATYDNSAAITAISFHMQSGSFSGGTAYVYGVK